MKKILILLSLLGVLSTPSFAVENWKGHTEVSPYEFGVMTGLSLYGTETGWGFLANGAYLIQPNGWVDDIDERLWLEVEAGPSFFSAPAGSTGTGFQYSTHVRWDFTYNEYWTAYALGGLSGYIAPGYLGSKFSIHPRFGMGVEYQTKSALMFRGEVSAEFTGVGIALNF
jgi:hypothetical protein